MEFHGAWKYMVRPQKGLRQISQGMSAYLSAIVKTAATEQRSDIKERKHPGFLSLLSVIYLALFAFGGRRMTVTIIPTMQATAGIMNVSGVASPPVFTAVARVGKTIAEMAKATITSP